MKRPEQIKGDIVKQWITKAQEDLGVAKHLVNRNASYFSAIGFHAQQAAEKFLKAFLVAHQVEFPKTHDLQELLDLVARVNHDLAESLSQVTDLNPYGVATRYPGDAPDLTAPEAEAAVSLAMRVQTAILKALEHWEANIDRVDKSV